MADKPGWGFEDRKREPGMWQQFRRRRVTRSVVIYLALAFLAIELTSSLVAAAAVPSWSARAVTGAAVLGFPLTVVLAWTYDVTSTGIVRTPDSLGPETPARSGPDFAWIVLSGAALLAAVVLRLLRS